MHPQLTYFLDQLDSSHVPLAGGKGSSLGELVRAGAPVPPAFVISSAAFGEFMRGANREAVEAIIGRLDDGQMSPADAAQRIAELFADVPMPNQVASAIHQAVAELGAQRVSVRSSATCEDGSAKAWAGQLDTYLDVPREDVVTKVRDCWLSIFSESALAYGAARGYGAGEVAVAVVVQEMVASDVSGIAFSVHPVTQEQEIRLIEACLGLGEAIVSGKIDPDQYLVERETNRIVERAVGGQAKGLFIEPGASSAVWRELGDRGHTQKLTDDQVREYAELLGRIEDHYGHPVDTEWALENGRFRVLQARPITTLAPEYREPIIDLANEWQPLVRRPMSLIEVSIWAHWLDSDHATNSLGMIADRALSIQDDVGLANDFLSRRAIEAGSQHVVDLYHNDRSLLIEILQRGDAVYRDAESLIARGPKAFRNLDDAVEFFVDAAQHTTVFPAWVLRVYEEYGLEDQEIRTLAEGLRSHTLYPSIERQIIDPLVASAVKAVGFSAPERAASLATWSELHQGTLDRDKLQSRFEAVEAGHRFVFQSIDGKDQVRFLSQSGYLLMRLAKQRQIVRPDDPNELSGQAAWPGVYRGRARLVLSPDAIGVTFEDGEVLISIQSSPELMPLLKRCGAIVTDDGGIACHAAIIARELRKPTLIGTKHATSVIRNGDLVEVDAFSQVVRIIERADAS